MRGVGYLISIISVFLIGAVAWPRPDEPSWKAVALLAGMAASIIGMAFRWIASRKQLGELRGVEQQVQAGQRPARTPPPAEPSAAIASVASGSSGA
ncbi:hypothetical protein [uncultured Sphingomonas sp.]|uniref:hypothetical protein n=1 Tax=uncultured Sphingomonas sp. TaxID=158754 RepID=UPI0025E885C9|nr:hypothetical protein [uncultured Sphingomonas sp.]